VAKTDVWSHLTKLYGAFLGQFYLLFHVRTCEPFKDIRSAVSKAVSKIGLRTLIIFLHNQLD
jgi:hypothetical protein